MLGKILPRHLQIIFEINDYFLKTMQEHYPDDMALLSRTSIIDESNGRRVRMARLAVVVSHKVNGVSELHSPADGGVAVCRFRQNLSATLHQRHQRRHAAPLAGAANPSPFRGSGPLYWPDPAHNLSQLSELGEYQDYPLVNRAVSEAKLANKQRLAGLYRPPAGVVVNPNALFDVQIKRIHEYKRQLMICAARDHPL